MLKNILEKIVFFVYSSKLTSLRSLLTNDYLKFLSIYSTNNNVKYLGFSSFRVVNRKLTWKIPGV